MIDPEAVPPEIVKAMETEMQEARERMEKFVAEGGTLPDLPYESAAIGDVTRTQTDSTAAPVVSIKRGRGRPRKNPAPVAAMEAPPVSAYITSLADFRERVAICREALVETYED